MGLIQKILTKIKRRPRPSAPPPNGPARPGL